MGASIPQIGFGTYRIGDHDVCVDTVTTALDAGYRHVDTAEAYGNEEAVGDAVRAFGREEVFLATKILHPKFTGEDEYDADDIYETGRACLDRLGVDSVDLFYGVHWPDGEPPAYDPDAVAEACERLADDGAFDAFGVCNLTPSLIGDLDAATSLSIDALQVELHPLLPRPKLREYCAREDIDVVAYGPLGNGAILDDPDLRAVADDHDATVAQVSLAWLAEKGVHPIPKSTDEAHIRENLASLELDLPAEAVARIDAIDREHRVYDPDYAPNW
jgi:2,5-diketo-D-gluconate reductase B